jgi:hypothetical protein
MPPIYTLSDTFLQEKKEHLWGQDLIVWAKSGGTLLANLLIETLSFHNSKIASNVPDGVDSKQRP